MNKSSFDKIINSLVLPQFPWIDDFEILVQKVGFIDTVLDEYYRVNYFVKPDEDGAFTVNDEFKKIIELTKNLFKMLGPEKNQIFEGVEFYVNNPDITKDLDKLTDYD